MVVGCISDTFQVKFSLHNIKLNGVFQGYGSVHDNPLLIKWGGGRNFTISDITVPREDGITNLVVFFMVDLKRGKSVQLGS